MPEVTLTLSTGQAAKVRDSLRKRAGADNTATDTQLLRRYLKGQLAGIVRYDAEEEAKKNIDPF